MTKKEKHSWRRQPLQIIESLETFQKGVENVCL